MPWPTERVVEMVAPTRTAMAIPEPVLPEDPDTNDADSTPVFNAYAADGDATGESSTSTAACRRTTSG